MAAVALEAREHFSEHEDVGEFIKNLPIKELSTFGFSAVSEFFRTKIEKFLANENPGIRELTSVAWILEDRSKAIDDLKQKMSDHLKGQGKVAIILFDNEENVHGRSNESSNESKSVAISGLLNLCGRFNVGASNVQLRYCIPAEQYFAFHNLSESSGKDFAYAHLLHWTVGELLSVIAHRYLLNLLVHSDVKDKYKAEFQRLRKFPIYTRDGLLDFFAEILPDEITNGRELPEKSLTYILRHFQVLPRQLIEIFNDVLQNSLHRDDSISEVSEADVVSAVTSRERGIAKEILKAYRFSYPEIEELVEDVVPNMPLVLSYDQLGRLYSRKKKNDTDGKSVIKRFVRHGVEVSPKRFRRALIETGVIGKIDNKPSGHRAGYINAEYECSVSGTLSVSGDDSFALHPIFSSDHADRAKIDFEENELGVYPHDADPTKEVDRPSIRSRYRM